MARAKGRWRVSNRIADGQRFFRVYCLTDPKGKDWEGNWSEMPCLWLRRAPAEDVAAFLNELETKKRAAPR